MIQRVSGRNQIPTQKKQMLQKLEKICHQTELDSNLGSASASHKGQGKSGEILGGGVSRQSGVYL